jgi:hypothetical protein
MPTENVPFTSAESALTANASLLKLISYFH